MDNVSTKELTITTELGKDSWKIFNNHVKTADVGSLSFIVPSRDGHSLFWVP